MQAYADDMILVAEDPKEMQNMINCLERYLRKLKLTLNTKKSKMQIFKKLGKTGKAEKWVWERKEIEIVQEYNYLGFWMQSDNVYKTHK